MDKQTLLEKINKADITPELKSQLINMVNSAQAVDQDLLNKVGSVIDEEAGNLIEEIANVELQVEADKYDKQMQAVGKDVDKFNSELNQKADEIDLKQVRQQIQ